LIITHVFLWCHSTLKMDQLLTVIKDRITLVSFFHEICS